MLEQKVVLLGESFSKIPSLLCGPSLAQISLLFSFPWEVLQLI